MITTEPYNYSPAMPAFFGLRLVVVVLTLFTTGGGLAQMPRDPGEAAYAKGLQLLAAASTNHSNAASLQEQANKYFKVGAELGHGGSMFKHALELSHPSGTNPPDLLAAAKWYERAAERGIPESAYNRALMLLQPVRGEKSNPGAAAPWLEMASTNGLAAAQIILGQLYETGSGVPQDDGIAAFLYRAASRQGDSEAGLAWARLIQSRRAPAEPGVSPQILIRSAAERGSGEAQEALAESLLAAGPPGGEDEIDRWFLAAAVNGRPLAQWKLGQRLRISPGAPTNRVEGVAWMLVASEGLNREALGDLRMLERELAASEWVLIRDRAAELRRQVAERRERDRKSPPQQASAGPPITLPSRGAETGRARQDSRSRDPASQGIDASGELPESYRKQIADAISKNFLRLRNDEARRQLIDSGFDRGQATLTFRLHADGHLTDLEFASDSTGGTFQVLLSEAIRDATPFPRWTASIRSAVGRDHIDLVQKFAWDPDAQK